MGGNDDRPKRGLAERGAACLAWSLRLFSVLQLLAGVGYIVMAVFLQFPPGDPLTLGLWAIGVLTILTSIFGLAGGCCRMRCCLGVYLVLSVLATLGQAGFVLYLFIDPAHAEQEVAKYQNTRDGTINDNLHSIIIYGRWGLLGLLAAQVAAIGVAAGLRGCTRARSYEEFNEGEDAAYEERAASAAASLEQLKSKLGLAAAASDSPTASKSVIHITAVSGSAAEPARQSWHQRRLAAAPPSPASMRSVLFERSSNSVGDDAKLEAEMEAGKISSRVATEDPTLDGSFSGAGAWSQAQQQQQRPFKPSWSKSGKQ